MPLKTKVVCLKFSLFTFFSFFIFAASSATAASRLPAARTSSAFEKDFGLGLEVGTIISATGKYWLNQRGAIDFGIGFTNASTTVVYGDYLWHAAGIFGSGTRFGRETSGYIGGGGGFEFWGNGRECGQWSCGRDYPSGAGLFIRGLVGFEWFPSPTRFGVFAELGPAILLTPRTTGALDLNVGGRYYF